MTRWTSSRYLAITLGTCSGYERRSAARRRGCFGRLYRAKSVYQAAPSNALFALFKEADIRCLCPSYHAKKDNVIYPVSKP
jgi:hypothetical protein